MRTDIPADPSKASRESFSRGDRREKQWTGQREPLRNTRQALLPNGYCDCAGYSDVDDFLMARKALRRTRMWMPFSRKNLVSEYVRPVTLNTRRGGLGNLDRGTERPRRCIGGRNLQNPSRSYSARGNWINTRSHQSCNQDFSQGQVTWHPRTRWHAFGDSVDPDWRSRLPKPGLSRHRRHQGTRHAWKRRAGALGSAVNWSTRTRPGHRPALIESTLSRERPQPWQKVPHRFCRPKRHRTRCSTPGFTPEETEKAAISP